MMPILERIGPYFKRYEAIILILIFAYMPLRANDEGPRSVEIDTTLTLKQIARRNQVPVEKLLKHLGLSLEQETCRPMQAGCGIKGIENAILNIQSLKANKASNSWFFALAKFAKWALKLLAKVFMQS